MKKSKCVNCKYFIQHYVAVNMKFSKLNEGHCVKGKRFKDIDLYKNEGCDLFEQSCVEQEDKENLEQIIRKIERNLNNISNYLKSK